MQDDSGFSSTETTSEFWLCFNKRFVFRPIETHRLIRFLTFIAYGAGFLQLGLFLIIMAVGKPGIFSESQGFMYLSDNFCEKKVLGLIFIFSTLPSWTLMAFSIAMEENVLRRKILLFIISTPIPTGLAVVLFTICSTPGLHYTFVNAFVFSVGCSHFSIYYTSKSFVYFQAYTLLLVTTALSGLIFLLFALFSDSRGSSRDISVLAEYVSILGFVVLNCFAADRIYEHIEL
jgi:hypothetical protein